jgi:hypothetical protein
LKRREFFGLRGGSKKRKLAWGAAMVRVGHAVLAAAMMVAMGKPVAAEVLDAKPFLPRARKQAAAW